MAEKNGANDHAKSEDELVALYRELTGADEKLARAVYSHLKISRHTTWLVVRDQYNHSHN